MFTLPDRCLDHAKEAQVTRGRAQVRATVYNLPCILRSDHSASSKECRCIAGLGIESLTSWATDVSESVVIPAV